MDSNLLAGVLALVGVASSASFVFLEQTGMLRYRPFLVAVGLLAVGSFAAAAWFALPDIHMAVVLVALFPSAGVIAVVYPDIRKGWRFPIVMRWPKQSSKISDGQAASSEIPAYLVPQLRHPKNDAIELLKCWGRDYSSLTIMRGQRGWPVHYPLRIYNIRPVSVEVISYTVTVSFNDVPIQHVKWTKPDTATSNGATPGNTSLAPDDWTVLHIPVVLSQVSVLSLPVASPSWSAMGELHFQGEKEDMVRRFDFSNDRYALSSGDWDDLRQNAFPK